MKNLKSRYRYSLILLKELVKTDFKLRYQGSVLGYAWSLLRPLFLFIILYVIFVRFIKSGGGIPHFPVYLLLGVLIWNFFVEMTTQSLGSIVGRGDLIRKINIPRWVIVFSISLSAVINLGLTLIIFVVLMIWSGTPFMDTTILIIPLLFEAYIFALGISLLLSALYVKFRDIGYIWEVILQAGFYLTPILYAMTLIPNVTIQKIMLLNPMAQIMQDARWATVSHDPSVITIGRVFNNGPYVLIPYAVVLLGITMGIIYFKRQSKSFAENI